MAHLVRVPPCPQASLRRAGWTAWRAARRGTEEVQLRNSIRNDTYLSRAGNRSVCGVSDWVNAPESGGEPPRKRVGFAREPRRGRIALGDDAIPRNGCWIGQNGCQRQKCKERGSRRNTAQDTDFSPRSSGDRALYVLVLKTLPVPNAMAIGTKKHAFIEFRRNCLPRTPSERVKLNVLLCGISMMKIVDVIGEDALTVDASSTEMGHSLLFSSAEPRGGISVVALFAV